MTRMVRGRLDEKQMRNMLMFSVSPLSNWE